MKKLIGVVILTLLLAGQALAAVEIERVVVGGVCRAWKHYNNAGDVTGIEIFNDAAIGILYADPSVVGSLGWAAGALASNGTLVIGAGTYMVDRPIAPTTNITIFAYGAKLKRINQVSSTTATAITAGVTNAITVADATGFLAGQYISILKSDGTTWNHNPIEIASVVGNVVTTVYAWEISATGTTGVHLAGAILFTSAGTKIYGVETDGNKANWIPGWWGAHQEIQMHGGDNRVKDCYIHDAPGEGIVESSNLPWTGLPENENNIYKNNKIIDINGNGIHLSASMAPLIADNHIENTNLQGAAVSHNGGCITFSAQIYGAKIERNTLINGRAGVGQLGNSHVRIVGNQIRKCREYAIEFSTVPNQNLYDAKIEDNDISDSVVAYFSSTGAPSTPGAPTGVTTSGSPIITNLSSMENILNGMAISGTGIPADSIIISHELSTDANSIVIGNYSREPVNCTASSSVGSPTTLTISGRENERIQIVNNRFIDTYLFVQRLSAVAITGNLFYHSPSKVDTNDVGMQIDYYLKDSSIKNNIFINGRAGFFANGDLTNVDISGNTVSNAKSYYIASFGTNVNVNIVGNTVRRDSSGATWDATGIYSAGTDSIKNNKILMDKGSHGIYIPGVAGVIVQGNTISGSLAGNSITIDAGSTAYTIVDNQLNKPILDTPRVATKIENNIGEYESLTAASVTLKTNSYTYLDTTSNDISGTLPDGRFVGERKIIRLSNATAAADGGTTVTVTTHIDSGNDICVFTSVDHVWILEWVGTKWVTIYKNTGSCS